MRNNLRMKKLAAAMMLAACSISTSAMAQAARGTKTAASSPLVTLHPAVSLQTGDTVLGPVAVSQPIHVVVTLKLRNEQQLDDYIAKPGFRPLTSGQFQLLYSPTSQQAQTVADYLTKAGFSNVTISRDHALVQADGRADTVQAAFHTSLVHVATHDGRDAFANNSAIQIPVALQDTVHAVLGLQTVHAVSGSASAPDPLIPHAMQPMDLSAGSAVAHQPSDFPMIYGASGMPAVTSVPVGSISVGSMTNVLADLKSLYPNVTVTLEGDTSAGYGSDNSGGDALWDMDSQAIIAFTGASQYYFYVAAYNTDASLETAISQVVSDNLVKVIALSFGECESSAEEDGAVSAMDTSFKQAVAQGQTFFASSGDGCITYTMPEWPASSQYVTAVGGTELYTSSNTTWQGEVAFDDIPQHGGATSGAQSQFEPLPSWQKNVTAYDNGYDQGFTYRATSDIAFDAAPGILITVDGQANHQGAGTNLSAPLAAGAWARVLQADGLSLGFASPVIYQVAQSSQINYSNAFHDVVSGTNNTKNAGLGWDYLTGWGSIVVNQFASMAAVNASAPTVSFGTLPALQATTPIPGSTHTPGDFNGDGISDMLWFNPTSSQIGYWTMNATSNTGTATGNVTRTGLSSYDVTPGYFVGAVGDFNNDGYADLVFTSANRDLWLWTNNQQGGWTSSRINGGSYPSQWQLIGAGDVNGDGYDDLLWLDPSDCEFGYWTMNGSTVTGYHTVNVACGYYPISIGYYSPSNRLSIIWTSPANDLYIWDSNGDGTFKAYDLTTGLNNSLPAGSHFTSMGGGYKGQNIGVQFNTTQGAEGGLAVAGGWLFSRTFDASGNQTGVTWKDSAIATQGSTRIAAAGYVIVSNKLNNTGVYDIDPTNMVVHTGGLYNSSVPAQTGNAPTTPVDYSAGSSSWSYPVGWWVVGAYFNNTAAPPWQ
ncbi:protease pro-enzyme activation domain-containing protein [Dyella dinghuensis]|uniref:protease pro-enzyme activation domain-containing protein n=1 Tax=Dyella dinghuensis TaxID=1920169 RepID=UPI00131546FF|nr:protease pro-enzyme activation domain-containing protein [Dyella dinghuensis]